MHFFLYLLTKCLKISFTQNQVRLRITKLINGKRLFRLSREVMSGINHSGFKCLRFINTPTTDDDDDSYNTFDDKPGVEDEEWDDTGKPPPPYTVH